MREIRYESYFFWLDSWKQQSLVKFEGEEMSLWHGGSRKSRHFGLTLAHSWCSWADKDQLPMMNRPIVAWHLTPKISLRDRSIFVWYPTFFHTPEYRDPKDRNNLAPILSFCSWWKSVCLLNRVTKEHLTRNRLNYAAYSAKRRRGT